MELKLNPKSNIGIKIKIEFLKDKLKKIHNKFEIKKIEEEINNLENSLQLKIPDVSNDIKKRMEWIS